MAVSPHPLYSLSSYFNKLPLTSGCPPNRVKSSRAFCNFFEGPSRYRLNHGVYNEEVRDGLLLIQNVIAPAIAAAVRASGGISLPSIIRRALHMGDETHSRNTAATLLFTRELVPYFLRSAAGENDAIKQTLHFLAASDYFFVRLAMAASKAAADAAHGVAGSTLVTAMTISWKGFRHSSERPGG